MRKNVFFLGIVCLCVLCSCKKDYVCICTVSGAQPGTGPECSYYDRVETLTYTKKKKEDAEKSCANSNRPLVGSGCSYESTTCKLQ